MLFSVLEAAHYNILPLGGRASEPRWAGPGGWCCCPAAARLAGMARIGSFAPLGLLGFVALPRSAGTCRLAGCSPLLPATPPETPAIIIYWRRRWPVHLRHMPYGGLTVYRVTTASHWGKSHSQELSECLIALAVGTTRTPPIVTIVSGIRHFFFSYACHLP